MSTKIEWTESTWNPLTGCTRVSPGCKHCYAERMAKEARMLPTFGYEQDSVAAFSPKDEDGQSR